MNLPLVKLFLCASLQLVYGYGCVACGNKAFQMFPAVDVSKCSFARHQASEISNCFIL